MKLPLTTLILSLFVTVLAQGQVRREPLPSDPPESMAADG